MSCPTPADDFTLIFMIEEVSHWTVSMETVAPVIKIQENRLVSTGVRKGRKEGVHE